MPNTDNAHVPPEAAPTEDLSIRDQLEAAFEATPTDAHPPAKPAADQAAPQPAAPVAAPGQSGRDEHGRFKAKEGAQEGAQQPAQGDAAGQAGPGTAPGPEGSQAPAPAELKPPASWRPEAREKWATTDPDVRAEVHKREREFQHVLQQAAGARQFQDAFERTVSPYQLFIRQENSTPLQAVDNLMRMAAVMRTGTPHEKVGVVANIVSQWGIDLQLLDNALAANVNGRAQPGQAQTNGQAFRDPRVDALIAQQQQAAYEQQQAAMQQITSGVESFESKHEFFNDVRVAMGDLIELAARRGEILPMDEAYSRACKMNESVLKILSQREAAKQNGTLSQAALRAKRAAQSVKGESTPHDGATVPKNDSVRAALEAAFEESDRR